MSDPAELQLYSAAWKGLVSDVASLLRDHPEIKVNWTDSEQWTALHMASSNGVEVVKLLLAHPDINVNMKYSNEQTPFSLLSVRRGVCG